MAVEGEGVVGEPMRNEAAAGLNVTEFPCHCGPTYGHRGKQTVSAAELGGRTYNGVPVCSCLLLQGSGF